jgi:hypothetical protein
MSSRNGPGEKKKKATSNYLPFAMHILFSLGKFNCVLCVTFKASLSQLDNIQIISIKPPPQMGSHKSIIEIHQLYNSI